MRISGELFRVRALLEADLVRGIIPDSYCYVLGHRAFYDLLREKHCALALFPIRGTRAEHLHFSGIPVYESTAIPENGIWLGRKDDMLCEVVAYALRDSPDLLPPVPE